MKTNRILLCIAVTTALTVVDKASGGNGYMGGTGTTAGAGGGPGAGGGEEGGEEGGARPAGVDGPLNDKGSDQGALYGDLYAILRYQGGETKRVPKVDANGDPVLVPTLWTDPAGTDTYLVQQQDWVDAVAVGGEPVLTEEFANYTVINEDTGEYELNPLTGGIWYAAPTPSQCVQPVADYQRWGDIGIVTGTPFNTIPLVLTYDPTWDRTEAAVGTVEEPTYFVLPDETWTDPNNCDDDGVPVPVTYVDGVLWTDLIKEVSFGRMNSVRSPDSVMWSSFDEAINSINQAVAIRVDASGRLLLTQDVYSEYLVDVDTGKPLWLGTVDKAIDSPLENMAIYYKLMRDGHLVTPGDERQPIDRSERGGIPVDQLLELEDGPSTALRPTIDIDKMITWGLGHLVDVTKVTYYTYYDANNVLQVETTVPSGVEYQTWVGIPTSTGSVPAGDDFTVCASTLSAAADKTGKITVDHVVYINSMLGINKVVGTSEDGLIDYTKNPLYFNYGGMPTYDREAIFASRGWYDPDEAPAPGGDPAAPGSVLVLGFPSQGDPVEGVWMEGLVPILAIDFRELGVAADRSPSGLIATDDIAGFTQAADDDLSVIDFVHTYQIPDNR